MLILLLIWLALLTVLVMLVMGLARSVGALTLAYFLSLSLIHVPGVLLFFGSGPQFFDESQLKLGFEITLIGMAAFIFGACLARGRATGADASRQDAKLQTTNVTEVLNTGWRVLVIGAIAYLFLVPIFSRIPSINAVTAAMSTLFVIGLWMQFHAAKITGDRRRLAKTFATLPILPVVSLTTAGFMGHGVSWVLSVLSFVFVIVRRRVYLLLAFPIILFLGLSVFVTYMGQRQDIRKVVWNQDTSIAQRVSTITGIVTNFEFLNLDSYDHRYALFSRLNQNLFVGVGAKRHMDGLSEFVYGDTVPWWALIPRAIWPDKPAVGGGGDLVTSFTKIKFDHGTSVGVGQVLEFYMNFGILGVLLGFMSLGFLLMSLDEGIMRTLTNGDIKGMIYRAMPGLALLQPGGNLLEILVAVASSLMAAYLLFYFKFLRSEPEPEPVSMVADSRLQQNQNLIQRI